MPDTQSLILLAAAMVAGVVCFRLFQILGRRTGHEPTARPTQHDGPRESVQAPPPAAALEAPDAAGSGGAAASGLVAIQLADRSFDTGHFLTGAREAYGRIVRAFAAGDRAGLAPLLAPAVLQAFEDAITARGTGTAPAFTALRDAAITGAGLEGRQAEITVTFHAGFTAPEGTSEGATQDVTDVWTFARDLDSADPNWKLVATSGAAPE